MHRAALIEAIVLGDGGPRATSASCRPLLVAGADTRLADREGRTPLQLAQDRGYEAMARALAAAGAR